jgi:hypothetical protein
VAVRLATRVAGGLGDGFLVQAWPRVVADIEVLAQMGLQLDVAPSSSRSRAVRDGDSSMTLMHFEECHETARPAAIATSR